MLASPVAATIPALVQTNAGRFVDHSALDDGEIRPSHAALTEACLAATRAFVAAGVQPGDRVGIWAPNIAEWVIAAVGLQGAGAVLVTLSTRLKGAEAAYTLRKSGARMLLTVNDFLDTSYVDLLADESLPALERTICLRGARTGEMSWQAFLEAGSRITAEEAVDEDCSIGRYC